MNRTRLITDAKMIINRARADLGPRMTDSMVRDLLLDNIPVKPAVIDAVLQELRNEGFIK